MSKQKLKKCNRIVAFLLIALLVFSDQSLLSVLATGAMAYEEEIKIENPTNEGNHSDGGEGSEENPSGGEIENGEGISEETFPEENLPSVSHGDALWQDLLENSVSSGDIRYPENYHEQPQPEDYGTLVAYDEYSRTYHKGGNNYVTVIGNDGATYLNEAGEIQDVDNTLVEGPQLFSGFSSMGSVSAVTTYLNKSNDYTVALPTELDFATGKGIYLVDGDYHMTLYPAEGVFADGIVKDNAIRYSNVFENIDYQYTVIGNSVKEDIILLEPTEKYNFSFYIEAGGLTPILENNILVLIDPSSEEEVFVLEAPEMEDAAGDMSFGVGLSLSEAGNGFYQVTVTADKDWLSAMERVYPVRIDPTAIQVTGSAIHIACAEEGSPNKVIGDNG